jgi:hypothetical protein
MIPNTLQFGLDLNDLPARATQVSSEEVLSISGGACIWASRVGVTNPYDDIRELWSASYQICPGICNSYLLKWTNDRRERVRARKGQTIECKCCK